MGGLAPGMHLHTSGGGGGQSEETRASRNDAEIGKTFSAQKLFIAPRGAFRARRKKKKTGPSANAHNASDTHGKVRQLCSRLKRVSKMIIAIAYCYCCTTERGARYLKADNVYVHLHPYRRRGRGRPVAEPKLNIIIFCVRDARA